MSIAPRGLSERAMLVASLVLAITIALLLAYYLNLFTPGLTVFINVNGLPVDAYVQVFALLPPGTNESLVEVWDGYTVLGFIRIPASALHGIAEEWVKEGYGNEGVGLEFAVYADVGFSGYMDLTFVTYRPGEVVEALSNPLYALTHINLGMVSINLW